MPISLTLRAVPPDQPNTTSPARVGDSRTVTTSNLSIGRGPINDWVLVDPLLSKTHCAISFQDGRYVLTDFSTNGVYVNGARQRIPKDTQVVLTDGDSFALGGYMVEVTEHMPARAAPDEFDSTEGATVFSRPARPPKDPFAPGPTGLPSYLERAEEEDPLQTVPPGARVADPLADPGHGAYAGGPHGRHDDPLAAPAQYRSPTAPADPPSAAGRSLDPFDFLDEAAPGVPAPDAQDLFRGKEADPSWSGPSQRDDVDDHVQAFTPPKAVWTGGLDDKAIDDLLGDDFPGGPAHAPPAGGTPKQAGPGAQVPPPGLRGGAAGAPPPRHDPFGDPAGPDPFGDDPLGDDPFKPGAAAGPRIQPEPPPPPGLVAQPPQHPFAEPLSAGPGAAGASPFDEPVVPRQPPTRPLSPPGAPASADAARLIAAFLQGAGVPELKVPQEDPEAYMRSVGELMRMMIERLREVLMSRAEVKRELGVEQTMLRSRNNNALKFSVTPEDAVAALLQPGRPGYLPPIQAAREALDDIGSHQVAVMAGVQTALFDLLKRFDPAALEKRLTSGSFIDNIMPAARKARIWELFCATYKDIAREAEDDFTSLFGREFARGYNEQVRKQ